jgi:hypothetical protein
VRAVLGARRNVKNRFIERRTADRHAATFASGLRSCRGGSCPHSLSPLEADGRLLILSAVACQRRCPPCPRRSSLQLRPRVAGSPPRSLAPAPARARARHERARPHPRRRRDRHHRRDDGVRRVHRPGPQLRIPVRAGPTVDEAARAVPRVRPLPPVALRGADAGPAASARPRTVSSSGRTSTA